MIAEQVISDKFREVLQSPMLTFGFLSALIFGFLTILVVSQFNTCLRELKAAPKGEIPAQSVFTPEARIILCLRGADPFLDRCLEGLASQDYPNYKVLIVVDSAEDESLPQVHRLLNQAGNARVELLIRDRLMPNCSRRASSLFCGLSHVPDNVEVVAMCDADAVPHSTWLRELVAPLSESSVVAASGNRWYSPAGFAAGGLCRYFWNTLAFRAMHEYQIPWCGSLAMRHDLFRDPEFQDCLAHAFSEDTALAKFLVDKQQRSVSIVSLVMVNEESISLKSFWGFLIRQMLAARLHHPHWNAVLVEALLVFSLLWIMMPLSILQGPVSFAWWALGGMTYDSIVLYQILRFEALARQHMSSTRNQPGPRLGLVRVIFAPLYMTLMGLIYSLAVVITVFTKSHEWRGVVYRIESRGVTTLFERSRFKSQTKGVYESI